MNRYFLFAYSKYYPSGGMNDCEVKFNIIEEVNFDELYTEYDYYDLYDVKLDSTKVLDIYQSIREYEEENGDLDYDYHDKFKLELIKGFIKENVE